MRKGCERRVGIRLLTPACTDASASARADPGGGRRNTSAHDASGESTPGARGVESTARRGTNTLRTVLSKKRAWPRGASRLTSESRRGNASARGTPPGSLRACGPYLESSYKASVCVIHCESESTYQNRQDPTESGGCRSGRVCVPASARRGATVRRLPPSRSESLSPSESASTVLTPRYCTARHEVDFELSRADAGRVGGGGAEQAWRELWAREGRGRLFWTLPRSRDMRRHWCYSRERGILCVHSALLGACILHICAAWNNDGPLTESLYWLFLQELPPAALNDIPSSNDPPVLQAPPGPQITLHYPSRVRESSPGGVSQVA